MKDNTILFYLVNDTWCGTMLYNNNHVYGLGKSHEEIVKQLEKYTDVSKYNHVIMETIPDELHENRAIKYQDNKLEYFT